MAGYSNLIVLNPKQPDEPFPPVELACDYPNGLLAVGGDLSITRLRNAYRHGIFPWFNDRDPICWWSPDPRTVLYPSGIHYTRSLRKSVRNKGYHITIDHAFCHVIRACAEPRSYQDGTWITKEIQRAYTDLHYAGFAHSFEVWDSDLNLVGGLYGVANGAIFCGESMFSRATDTSKIAFVALAYCMQAWGFRLIDCQLENNYLMSMGAVNIPRAEFVHWLQICHTSPNTDWQFPITMQELSEWNPTAASPQV